MLRISSTYLASGNFLCTFCKRWRRDGRKFQVMSFTRDFNQRYITSCQNTVKWSMTRFPYLSNMRKASSYAASRMDSRHGKARSSREAASRPDGRNKAVTGFFNERDDGKRMESHGERVSTMRRYAQGDSLARRSQKLIQQSDAHRVKALEKYGKTVQIKSNFKILTGEDDWDESAKEMIGRAKLKTVDGDVAWSRATSNKAGKAFTEFHEMISVPGSMEMEQYLHEQNLRKKAKQAKKRSVNVFKVSDPYVRQRLHKNKGDAGMSNQSHLLRVDEPQCEFAEVQCGKKKVYVAYLEDALPGRVRGEKEARPVKALQKEIMSLPPEKLRKVTPEKIAKMAQKKPLREGMIVKVVQDKPGRVVPLNLKLPKKSNDFKVFVNLKNPRDDMCPLVHFEEKTPDGPVGQTMKFQVKKMEKYWFSTGHGRVRIQYLTGVLTNFRNRLKEKLEMPKLLKSPAGLSDQTKVVHYHNADEGTPSGKAAPPTDEQLKESLTKKLKVLTSNQKESKDAKKEDEHQSMFKMLMRKGMKLEGEKKDGKKSEAAESGATKTLGSIGKLMQGVVKPKVEQGKEGPEVRSKPPGLDIPLKPAGKVKEATMAKAEVSKKAATSEEKLLPPLKTKTVTPAWKEIEKINREKQAEQSRIPIPVVTDPYFTQLHKQKAQETAMRRESQKLSEQGQQIQPVGVTTSHQPTQVRQEQQNQPAGLSPPYQASQSGQMSQEQQSHPVGGSPSYQQPQSGQMSEEQQTQPTGLSPPYQASQPGQQQAVGASPPYQIPQPGQIYEQQQYQMPPPELASQQQAETTNQIGGAPGWVNPPSAAQPQQQNAPPQQSQDRPTTTDVSHGFLPPETVQPGYQWNPRVQGHQDMQPVTGQENPPHWAPPYQWYPQQMPQQIHQSPPVPSHQQNQEVQPAEANTAQPQQQKPPTGHGTSEEKEAQPPPPPPPQSDFYYPDLGPKITKPIKKPPTAQSPRRVSFSTVFRDQGPFIPIRVEVPPFFMDKDIRMYDTQKELEETMNKPIPEDDPPSYHWDNWRIPGLRKIARANSSKTSFIIDSDSLGDGYAARKECAPETAIEYNYDQEPDLLTFERAVAQNFTQVEDADLMSVTGERGTKADGEKSVRFTQEKAPAVDIRIPDGGKPGADVVGTDDNHPGYLSYINQLPSYAQSAFEYFHPAEVFDSKTLQNFVSYPLRMATAQWSTYHAAAHVPKIASKLITDSEASRSVTFQEGADTQANEAKAPMAFVARSTDREEEEEEEATRMSKTKSLVSETKKASHADPNDPHTEPETNKNVVIPPTEKLENSKRDSKVPESDARKPDGFDLQTQGSQGISRESSDTTKNTEKLGDGELGKRMREELLRKLKNELTTKLKDQWDVKLFDELTDRVRPVVENKLLPEKARKQLFLEKASSQANTVKKTPPKKEEEEDYRKKSPATPVMTFRETEHLIQPRLRSEAILTGAGVSAMDWSQQKGFSFHLEKQVVGEQTAKLNADLKTEKTDKEDDKQKMGSSNPEKAPPVPHIPEKDHPYLPRKDLPENPQKREAEPQPRQPVLPHHKDHPYLPRFDQPPPKRETPIQPHYPEQPYYSPGNPYHPQADPPSVPYYPFTQPTQPYQPQKNPPSQPYHPQTQPSTSPYNPQTHPPSQPQQPQTQPPCQPCQPQTFPPTQPHQPHTQPYYPQTQPATHPNQPKPTPQPSTPIYPRQQASEIDSEVKIETDTQIFSTKEPEIQTAEQLTEEWKKYFEQVNRSVEERAAVETGKERGTKKSEVYFFKDNTPTAKPEEEQKAFFTNQFFPQHDAKDKKEEEKKNLATIRPDKEGPAQFDKYKEDFRKLKEEETVKPTKTQDVNKAASKPMEAVAKATGDQTKGRGDSGPRKGQDQRKGGSDKEESEKRQERMEAKEAEKRKNQELVAAEAMEMKLELAAKKDRRLRDELEAKKRQELRRQPTVLGYGSVVYDKPLQQATQIIQIPIDKKQEDSKDKKPVQDEKKIQFPTPEKPSIKSKMEEPKPIAKAKTEESKPAGKAKTEEPKQVTEKQTAKTKPEEPKPTAKQSKLLDVLLPKKSDEKKPEKIVKVGGTSEEKSKAKASKPSSDLIDFSKKAVEKDKKTLMGGEAKKESDKKEKLSPVRESERKVQGESDKLKIDEGKKDKKTAKSDSNLGKAGDDKSGKGQPTKATAGKTSEEKAKAEETVKRKSSLSEWEKEIASKASSIFGLGSDKSKAKKDADKSKSVQQEVAKVKKPEERKADESGKGESFARGKIFELPKINSKDRKGGESSGSSKTPKMDAQDDSVVMEARVEQYMKMYEPPTKAVDPVMVGTDKADFLKPKTDEVGYYLTPTEAVTAGNRNVVVEPTKSDSHQVRIVKIIFDDTKKDVDVVVEQGKKAEMDRREEEMKSSFEMMKTLLNGKETEAKVIIPTVKGDQPLTCIDPYMQILEMALANEKNKMKAQQERRDSNLQSFVDLLKNAIVSAEEATEKAVTQASGLSAESFASFLRLFRTAIDSAESELQRRFSVATGEGDIRKTGELDLQSFMTVLKDAIADVGGGESVGKSGRERGPAFDHIDAVRKTKKDAKSEEQMKIEKVAMGFGMSEMERHEGEGEGQIADNKGTREETKITELKKPPEEGFVTAGTTGKRDEPIYIAPHLREIPEVSPKPKRESFMVSVPPTAERAVKEFVIREEASEIEAVPTGDETRPTHPGKNPEVVCIQSSIRSARVDKSSMKDGKTGKFPRTILPDVPKTEKPEKSAVSSLVECKTAREPPTKPVNEEARAEELRKALTEESSESEPVSVAADKRTKGISRTKTAGGSQQKRDLQTLATAMLKDAERYEPNRLIMRKLLGKREAAAASPAAPVEEEEEKDDESPPPSGDLDDALRHKIASAPYRKTELPQTEKEMSGIRDKTELKTVRVFDEPPPSPMDTRREYIQATAKKANEVPCVLPVDPENPPEEPPYPSIPPPKATPILPPESRKSKPKFWWQK